MEDVLAVYQRPYDPKYPLICFDERPCQLIGEVVAPRPMEPGKPMREDHHYQRNGVCTLFLAFDPHRKQRIIQVRERRTKRDYALFMKALKEKHYPKAEEITLVQDNLNTHSPGSFYEAFSPEEAFALTQRFELHYTPLHASWLNMAELELAALTKQCLDRRIPDRETLAQEAAAWQQDRNARELTVTWQFTTDKAREKFKRHYPENTQQN
jgi:hypothetical protein